MVSDQTEPPELDPPTPLPRGRNDLSPDEVARHQRERVIAAVAVVIARHGYPGLTVERVIGAARISRTTFYQLYDNKQQAVLDAHELIFDRLIAMIRAACEREGKWPGKVGAAFDTLIEFASARPEQARFLLGEYLAADAAVAERARDSHDQLAVLLAGARRHYPKSASYPPRLERAMVAGLRSLLARGLGGGELEGLRGELVQITLLPYLGTEAMKTS